MNIMKSWWRYPWFCFLGLMVPVGVAAACGGILYSIGWLTSRVSGMKEDEFCSTCSTQGELCTLGLSVLFILVVSYFMGRAIWNYAKPTLLKKFNQ
jgi:hypothetical protein